MKRHKNFNLLLMLVLLVAVGQMAQTIYIPAIADMAVALNVREGAVQSVMAAYLLTYGISQLFYGPLSDRVGRRPVILVGMSIFMLATLVAITTHSLAGADRRQRHAGDGHRGRRRDGAHPAPRPVRRRSAASCQ